MQSIILVIEDNRAIRELFRSMLTMEGYQVVLAENGEVGLQQAQTISPDVIIVDLGMPVMDGRAFIDAYRQCSLPQTPIILTSAYQVEPSLRAKVNAFIPKPFDYDMLLETLNNVLQHRASV